MDTLEKLSEGGTLALAIGLSCMSLLAVPIIYLLLRSWKKKHGKKLDEEDTGESPDGVPEG